VKYMLLIYNNPATIESLSEQERAAVIGEVDAIMAELAETGELVGGNGLAHPSTAKTISLQGGAVAATDGPFAEAKEQFAGYLTVDCESEAAAPSRRSGRPAPASSRHPSASAPTACARSCTSST
jgi:hypothetical protein